MMINYVGTMLACFALLALGSSCGPAGGGSNAGAPFAPGDNQSSSTTDETETVTTSITDTSPPDTSNDTVIDDSTIDEPAVPSASLPLAPTDLQASPSHWLVRLVWMDHAIDETGFEIVRFSGGDVAVFDVPASPQSGSAHFEDEIIESGVGYRYRVRAYNSNGYSAYSNEAVVIVP